MLHNIFACCYVIISTTKFTDAFTVQLKTTSRCNVNSNKFLPNQLKCRQRPLSTFLFMSDIPNDNKDNKSLFTFKLPPFPEDKFVLAGDLVSLFVYGFFDHFICQDCANMALQQADSPAKLQALAAQILPQYASAADSSVLATPVWLPNAAVATTWYSDHVYQVLLSDQAVARYSPLLQPTGLATCLLASCWLLAGWWHSAFAYQNTLDCKPEKSLTKTAQTWVSSCALLCGLVVLSHLVCGCFDIWGSFTKGDVGYIVDSLTVLIMWRYMASSLLGYWKDDD